MGALEPTQERLQRHLREAKAHSDADRVAFWTVAIECWERPIPDYARSELNQFSLKERAGARTRESTRNRGVDGSFFASKGRSAKGARDH